MEDIFHLSWRRRIILLIVDIFSHILRGVRVFLLHFIVERRKTIVLTIHGIESIVLAHSIRPWFYFVNGIHPLY